MNLISLEKVVKAYAHRTLLDSVSLGVSDRDRIGIVGRNGAGKSTLLGLLAGTVQPDTGRVARTSGLRIGYLAQGNQLTGTVEEVLFGSAPREVPWESDPLARAIVGALLGGISLAAEAATCPAASGARSRWRACWRPPRICCSSMSRPTTWTSRRSTGSASICATGDARWWW